MENSLSALQARAQRVLDETLTDLDVPVRLLDAMRYSTLAGGKRVRALLVYAAGKAVGAPLDRLDSLACAVECMHAYSLIHDDLPAMDDDDLRRGQATNHIKFDVATAILAGDALQCLAFELIANSTLSDQQARAASLRLARGSGPSGMVGGQMLDILATEQTLSRADLENVHQRKTGALISAAVVCGALCGDNTTEKEITALELFAQKIGLAFQVVDDILDIEASTEELGKPNGSDLERGKATYPALMGLAESKQLADTLYHEAMESIALISDNTGASSSTALLQDLATLVVKRTN